MIPVRMVVEGDGITFSLSPETKNTLERRNPDVIRSTRVFVAGTRDVAEFGPATLSSGHDPQGRLKAVVTLLTGIPATELPGIRFYDGDREVFRLPE